MCAPGKSSARRMLGSPVPPRQPRARESVRGVTIVRGIGPSMGMQPYSHAGANVELPLVNFSYFSTILSRECDSTSACGE